VSTKQTPVNKNQTIELTFEDITHDGNGVGKINGYPIFVTNVLPGEKAKVKVIKVKKNFRLIYATAFLFLPLFIKPS